MPSTIGFSSATTFMAATTQNDSKTLVFPKASENPGRLLRVKDISGTTSVFNPLYLSTVTGDRFEGYNPTLFLSTYAYLRTTFPRLSTPMSFTTTSTYLQAYNPGQPFQSMTLTSDGVSSWFIKSAYTSPLVNSNRPQPNDISGLVLWFDADSVTSTPFSTVDILGNKVRPPVFFSTVPYLYTSFFNNGYGWIGNAGNSNGPPGFAYSNGQGTPGQYNPIAFPGSFPTGGGSFNTYARGYVFSPVNTFVQFSNAHDDGLHIKLNQSTIYNNWTNASGTTNWAILNAGFTPIELIHQDGGGGCSLTVNWQTSNSLGFKSDGTGFFFGLSTITDGSTVLRATSGGLGPYLQVSSLNGRNTLFFSTSQQMALFPNRVYDSFSMFFVARMRNITNARMLQGTLVNSYYGYQGGRKNILFLDNQVVDTTSNFNITTITNSNWDLYSVTRDSRGNAELYNMGCNCGKGMGFIGIQGLGLNTGTAPTERSVFDFAELVVYNQTLNPLDRQRVEGYLAQKYGFTGLLPISHPFSTQIPSTITSPSTISDIPNLRLWFDATQLNASNGQKISSLSNLAGTGEFMGSNGATSTSWPSFSTNNLFGYGVLDFTNTQTLFLQQVRTYHQHTTFAVTRWTGFSNRYVLQGSRAATYYGYASGYNSWAKRMYISSEAIENTGAAADTNWDLNRFSRSSNGIASYAAFGSNVNRGYATVGFDGLAVGIAGLNTDSNNQSYCQLAEVLVYDRELSLNECFRVETYLSRKYNLALTQSNLVQSTFSVINPAATPFVQSTISSLSDIPNLRLWFDPSQLSFQIHPYRFSSLTGFSPSSIPTLDAWYDASGLSNFAFSTGLSTIHVSSWYNKMAPVTNFGKTLLQTTIANAPFYDTSGGGVFFNGQTRFMTFSTAPAVVQSTFTIFVMERRQASPGNYFLGGTTGTLNQNLYVGYNTASNVNFDMWTLSLSPVVFAGYSNRFGGAQEPYRIWSIWSDGLNKRLFLNGHFVGIQDIRTVGRLAAWAGAAVGRIQTTYYTGNVREMLFYSNALSDPERQAVEGYLAWRWGLQGSLMTPTFVSTMRNLTILGADMVNTSNIRYWPILISSPTLNNQNILQFDTLRTMALNAVRYYPKEYTLFSLQRQTGFPGTNRYVLQAQTSANYYGYNSAARKNTYIQEGFWIEQVGLPSDSNWDLYTFWKTPSGQATFSRFGSNINSYYAQTSFDGLGINTGNDINTTSDCEVGEILLYDRSLSLQERSRVEKYIADKYNLTSNLLPPNTFAPSTMLSTISSISSIPGLKVWYDPSQLPYITHPYLTVNPNIPSPRTLSSCILWFDASGAQNFTLTNSSISVWFDKSGIANNATQPLVINRPLYNSTLNAVVFDGATRFMPFNVQPNIIARDYTIFVLEQRQATAGYPLGGTATINYQNLGVGYNATNSAYFDVYGIGYTATIDSYSARSSNEPYRIWCYRYGSNVQNINLNGYQLTNRVLSNTNDMLSWAGAGLGRYVTTFYNGRLRELIMYNTYLTDSQMQQIEGYLAWKWGLQGLLQSNTPVSTLSNLTGLPVNMSNTGQLITMPYLSSFSQLNNRSVLQFTTGRTLAMNPQRNFSGEYSLFYLSRHTFTPSATNRAILQSQNDFMFYGYYAGKKNIFYSEGSIEINGCNADGAWNLYTFQRDSNGIGRFANFGSNIAQGYAQTAIQGLAINTGYDVNQSSDCFVGELLLYDRYLNIQECGQVEAYIADKYNLTSNLLPPNPQSNFFVQSTISSLAYISNLKYWFDPTQLSYLTHPYKTSTVGLFSPSSISTLDCWYDASGTSNFVLNNSSVQTWYDLGPNARHLSQATLINSPSFSTTNEVVFNGATRFMTFGTIPGIVLSDYTIFVVEKRQSSAANYFLGGTTQTNFQNFHAGYNATNSGYMDIWSLGTGVTIDSFLSVPREPYRIWCFQYGQAAQNRRMIIDGLTYASFASVQDLTAWLGAGVGRVVTTYYTGNIREIIMYSNYLSDDQRQLVEGYLATKWGLQSNLMPFTPVSTLRNLTQLGSDLTTQFATQLLNYPALSTTTTLGPSTGTQVLAFTTSPFRSMQLNAVRIYPKEFTFFTLSRMVPLGTTRTIFQGQTTGGYYGYDSGWSGYRKAMYNLDGAIEYTGLVNDTTWDLHMFQKTSNGIGSVFYYGSNLNRYYTQTGFEGFGINTPTNSNASSDCQVGEMMIFDRALTTFERKDIEQYYVNKYSLQTKYNFYNQTVQISTISSLSISSLQIWFDATQVQAPASTLISSIPNLITTGLEVMSNTTGQFPRLVSTIFGRSTIMNVLAFSTASNMVMTPSRLYSQFTFFNVTRHMPGGTNRRIWQGTTGDYLYGYWNGSKLMYYGEQWQLQSAGYPANSRWDLNCISRNTLGVLSTLNWNGSMFIPSTSTSFLGLENLAINSNTAETSDCQIAEALVYNRQLLLPEVQEVEGYLGNKYLLQSNFPLTHPYFFVGPSTVTVDPSKLSNVAFWLDTNSVSSVVFSDGLMSRWNDNLGNIPVVEQNDSNAQPFYDPRKASLEFRNNQYLDFSNADLFFTNRSFTLIMLEKRTSSNANNYIFGGRDATSYSNLQIGYKDDTTFSFSFAGFGDDTDTTVPAYRGLTEPFRLWTLQYDQFTREIFLYSSSVSVTYTSQDLLGYVNPTIGRNEVTSSYYNGYLVETLFFTPSLSTPDRWTAEAYLAWKYNLRTLLDGTNPYRTGMLPTIL